MSSRIADFTQRIRARLSEIDRTPIGVAVDAGLPRDAIRSVLRGHPPHLQRAHDICCALDIAFTIGTDRPTDRLVDEPSILQTADLPAGSHDGPRAECLAPYVGARLADLFDRMTETYEMARSDGERDLVLTMLDAQAASVRKWITSSREAGDPPFEQLVPLDEEMDDP